MLDGGFEIDIGAINENIDEAQVISLYFPVLGKTLLLDTRTSAEAGPLVCLLEMVSTPAERMQTLRRLRPQFTRPGSMTLIPWMRRVASLSDTGVWEHLVARLESIGDPDCLAAASACREELEQLERRELVGAVTGEQYRTLWGRSGVGDLDNRRPGSGPGRALR